MNATATRPTVRIHNIQVLELDDAPGHTDLAAMPDHFRVEINALREDVVETRGGETACHICKKNPVGWYVDECPIEGPGWAFHSTVLVTVDGGATVKAMCEECSGDIGPEVIFA